MCPDSILRFPQYAATTSSSVSVPFWDFVQVIPIFVPCGFCGPPRTFCPPAPESPSIYRYSLMSFRTVPIRRGWGPLVISCNRVIALRVGTEHLHAYAYVRRRYFRLYRSILFYGSC